MERIPVIWRRFGKEHGEDGFRVNPPEVVELSLRTKAEKARQLDTTDWLWEIVSDRLIVERPKGETGEAPPTIFYLPDRQWMVIQNSEQVDG